MNILGFGYFFSWEPAQLAGAAAAAADIGHAQVRMILHVLDVLNRLPVGEGPVINRRANSDQRRMTTIQ